MPVGRRLQLRYGSAGVPDRDFRAERDLVLTDLQREEWEGDGAGEVAALRVSTNRATLLNSVETCVGKPTQQREGPPVLRDTLHGCPGPCSRPHRRQLQNQIILAALQARVPARGACGRLGPRRPCRL